MKWKKIIESDSKVSVAPVETRRDGTEARDSDLETIVELLPDRFAAALSA